MSNNNNQTAHPDRAQRLFFQVWAAIGIALILIGCGYVFGQVWTSISIILFSAFLVFVLRVPVAWLNKKGIPRAAGAALSYLGAIIIIAGILLIFLPILITQLTSFINSLPGYAENAQAAWDAFYAKHQDLFQDSFFQQFGKDVGSELSRWAAAAASQSPTILVGASTQVINALIVTGVSIIVGFWVLKDLPTISREILAIVGPRHAQDAHVISNAFSRALGGYLRGMVVASCCTGTMAGIFYYVIGLPYPVVLGLLTGLMNFIPFLGPWIAGTIAALLGLFISPVTAILAIALTIVAQQITDNFISPRVMSGAVDLHPSMILVVLFAGAALGGIFGLLCAVPLTAAAKAIFVYYFERKTGRTLTSYTGALFKIRAGSGDKLDDELGDAAPAAAPKTPDAPTATSKTKAAPTAKPTKRAPKRKPPSK
ncbi:MAG: AI-2E family transporter [Coriobacteriia bacterium]|nr:AI-2E family transporter [Coriobacteriia bacterium]